VYVTKSRRLRTPQEKVWKEERLLSHLARDERFNVLTLKRNIYLFCQRDDTYVGVRPCGRLFMQHVVFTSYFLSEQAACASVCERAWTVQWSYTIFISHDRHTMTSPRSAFTSHWSQWISSAVSRSTAVARRQKHPLTIAFNHSPVRHQNEESNIMIDYVLVRWQNATFVRRLRARSIHLVGLCSTA